MLGIRIILVMQLELRMDFYMIILFELQIKRSMVILGNSTNSLMILEQTIMNELMIQIFLKKLTMQERLDLIERHD